MTRGYFGIGIVGCKTKANLGGLWRSAHCFGAAFLVMIGPRYTECLRREATDTTHARLHIPLFCYPTFDAFLAVRPWGCPIIGVEQTATSKNLCQFLHPDRALYLLGAEDTGLPGYVVDQCQSIIAIDTKLCLNVATAGSIVMYDRSCKHQKERVCCGESRGMSGFSGVSSVEP